MGSLHRPSRRALSPRAPGGGRSRPPTRRRRLRPLPLAVALPLLGLVCVVSWSPAAEDSSRGRDLLEEGVALRRADPARAGPVLQEALSLLEQAGDLAGQAEAYRNLGILERSAGRGDEALRLYGIALDLARRAGDAEVHGAVLNSLGILHRRQGDYARALEAHTEGLELARQAGDLISQARLMGSIRRVHEETGDVAAASLAARLAVALGERGSAPPDLMQALLSSLAVTLTKEGRLWEALDVLGRVEGLEGIPESLLWSTFNTRSLIFRELGDLERAYDDSTRAVELARQAAGRADLLGIQYNLALIMEERGETESSSRILEECLAGLKEIGDDYETLYVLSALGTQAFHRGDVAAAASWNEQALDLAGRSGIEDPFILEEVHRTRAGIALARGGTEEAADAAAEAIRLADLSGEDSSRARAREALAQAEQARGNHDAAEALLREAVAVESELRARLPLASRLTLGRLRTRPSRRLALLLLDRSQETGGDDRVEEASRILDRDRARTFLEMLSDAGARRTAAAPGAPAGPAGGQENPIITSIARELIREEDDPERRRALRVALGLGKAGPPPGAGEAGAPAVSEPRDLDLAALRDLLGREQAVLVEFLLGSATGWAVLTTPGGIEAIRLAGWDEILSMAARIEPLLSQAREAPGPDPRRALERLSALVLHPWIDRVPAGTRRIVIAPDGILERVPFEALPVPSGDGRASRYLVEDYALLYVPSGAAWLAMRQRDGGPEPGSVLVIADPAYDARGEPVPLHASRAVSDLLARLAGDTVASLLGEEATEASWKRIDPSPYQVIHLAAHGVADLAHPARSGIILPPGDPGEDGLIQMGEILASSIRADLVVLSACRSAVGPVDRAEGMISLPLAFLESGAGSVLATLWEVGDRSATGFIQEFYEAAARGERPVDALRSAKLEMIRSGDAQREAVAAWAPFILIGDAGDRLQLSGGSRTVQLLAMGAVVLALLLAAWLLDRILARRARRAG